MDAIPCRSCKRTFESVRLFGLHLINGRCCSDTFLEKQGYYCVDGVWRRT